MEEICGGPKPYLQTALLEAEHGRVRDKALHAFHSKRKMGGEEFSQSYCEQLIHVSVVVLMEEYWSVNAAWYPRHKEIQMIAKCSVPRHTVSC